MTDHAAPLPRQGRFEVVGRLSTNACIATIVAGTIALGQWVFIDRPQQDRLTRQGEAAMLQADAHSLNVTVTDELQTLAGVVAAQTRTDSLLPETRAALTDARVRYREAFNLAFVAHAYTDASSKWVEVHDIVQGALCFVQHFEQACEAIPLELVPKAEHAA